MTWFYSFVVSCWILYFCAINSEFHEMRHIKWQYTLVDNQAWNCANPGLKPGNTTFYTKCRKFMLLRWLIYLLTKWGNGNNNNVDE